MPKDKKKKNFQLRVGQFNVLNLVRENVKFYGNQKYSLELLEKKLNWMAHQLQQMNADVVGFEEVFHVDPLERAIKKSGLYPKGEIVSFGADGTNPTVALVSAFPVLEKESISDFPPESILNLEGVTLPITKFSRPVLRAVVQLPTEHKVTFFVTHLKSKRPIVDEPNKRHDQKAKAVGHALSCVVRAAEAAALRCLLVDEMHRNSQPVIVLGDLNDVLRSVSTQIVTGTPPWKSLPKSQKEAIWDTLLWSTNEVQVRLSDRDVTYTHIHNGHYEVLDHILVSQEFVRSNPEHIGYVQFLQHFNDHLVDWTLSEEPQDLTKSDHGQVVAVIRIRGKKDQRGGGEREEKTD
jgi:predicted extracellular nuclease